MVKLVAPVLSVTSKVLPLGEQVTPSLAPSEVSSWSIIWLKDETAPVLTTRVDALLGKATDPADAFPQAAGDALEAQLPPVTNLAGPPLTSLPNK